MATSSQDIQNEEENIPHSQQPQNEENIPHGHDFQHVHTQNEVEDNPSEFTDVEENSQVEDKQLAQYLPLYRAAFNGDWKTASMFFKIYPSAMAMGISVSSKTALHIAASLGHTYFVEELVKMMPEDALEMQNDTGDTALHFAVVAGDIKAVQAMVNKNPKLTEIKNNQSHTPILQAAVLGNKEILLYLYKETKDEEFGPFRYEDGVRLLNAVIDADFYDVALLLVQRNPYLAITRDYSGNSALDVLARRPLAFRSGSNLGLWQSCIYRLIYIHQASYIPNHYKRGDTEDPGTQDSGNNTEMASTPNRRTQMIIQGIFACLNGLRNVTKHIVPHYKETYNSKLMHIQAEDLVQYICHQVSFLPSHSSMLGLVNIPFLVAAKYGSVELINYFIQYFPRLMWATYGNDHTILHIAIEHRQEKVFNLLRKKRACVHQLASFQDQINGTNILHLAAKIAPPAKLNAVSGAALQMQRELQWFKAAEEIAQPTYKDLANANNQTPRILFTEEHKELVKTGEKWMRQMATSCSVVAMLIATVVFAAPFTVPGGNSNAGIPTFLENKYFMVFVISDALGLVSSLTSLLIFLSVLTSCYAEEDFLNSLPRKLVFGLTTLFLSVTAMLIAFGSIHFIMFHTRLTRIPILIVSVASLPVIIFACQHVHLLYELIRSTYVCDLY